MLGERKIASMLAILGIVSIISGTIQLPYSPKVEGETKKELDLPVIKNRYEVFLELTEKARQEKEARIAEEKRIAEQKKKEEQKILASSQSRGGYFNKGIYNPYNVGVVSGVSLNQLNIALSGTGLKGLADVYIQAEREYGVNALFLVGLTALESGWGTSHYAKNYNNLAGNYTNGSITRYGNKAESIYDTARLIANYYLNPNGNYYNGTSIWNINVKYCESKDWADKINSIVKGSLIK